jgi:hypothetical protein
LENFFGGLQEVFLRDLFRDVLAFLSEVFLGTNFILGSNLSALGFEIVTF